MLIKTGIQTPFSVVISFVLTGWISNEFEKVFGYQILAKAVVKGHYEEPKGS